MVELQTLARYPFLTAAKDYVKENALSIHELLTDSLYDRARVIGLERLENAFEKRDVGNRTMTTDSDYIMELLSYPISRMIAVCVDDTYFKRRYALGEAVHAYNNLIRGSPSFILDIAKEFHLDVRKEENPSNVWVHFTDYLHYAPTRYKQWKMTNRGLSKGYIRLSSKDIIRLIQEALRLRINEELDERRCNPAVSKVFSEDIQRFKNRVLMHRKKI
jgi:DNA primase large subunit